MKSTQTKKRSHKPKRIFTLKQYKSGDGMLTNVWGPSLWHFMHIMSFNYPDDPTRLEKKHYRNFMLNLQHVLPCKYCRQNLVNNFKQMPLHMAHMKNRDSFSRYIYNLHEHINKMLGKYSGLTYCEVRERYEHFRARCTSTSKKTRKKNERGCTEPLYGKKSKCIIKIVPQETICPTLQIDQKCLTTTTK